MENVVSRTKIHEMAMICIYQHLFYAKLPSTYKKSLNEIVNDTMEIPYDECDPFFKQILFEKKKKKKEFIQIISEYLSKTWTFNRLSLVDQAILLLFCNEICNHLIPTQVAIDVAVDLAKKYCDDPSYKYIHAVLDKVGKNYG